MIKPDDIQFLHAERTVLGYCIKHKDHKIFYNLHGDLFFNPDTRTVYDFLVKTGLKSKELLSQMVLDDQACKIDARAFDEFVYDAAVVMDDDINWWVDRLAKFHEKRKLAEISLRIQDGLEKDSSPFDCVGDINKLLGNFYVKSTSSEYDLADKCVKILQERPLLGIPTGIKTFDSVTGGLVRGGITSIGGITGNMKSTSSVALMRSMLTINEDMRGMIFEIDMEPNMLIGMIVGGQEGADRGKMVKNEMPMRDIEKILKKDPLRKRLDFKTFADDHIHTFDQIQRIVMRERPDIWLVDYMGRLVSLHSSAKKHDKPYNQWFTEIANNLRSLASQTYSIGLVIHQANYKSHGSYGKQIAKDPRPTLAEIEYSSDVVRLSDYVYLCYYPAADKNKKFTDDAQRVFIQMWKKSRTSGSTFTVMEIDPPSGMLMEPSTKIRQMGLNHMDRLDKKYYPDIFQAEL